MMKPEIRLPLSGVFFLGIGAPFVYRNNLGMFTALCFSIASLILFYVFAIMPIDLKHDRANLENDYNPIYHRVVQKKIGKIDSAYQDKFQSWVARAVIILVFGIIGLLIIH